MWHKNPSSGSKNFLIPQTGYFYLNTVNSDLGLFEDLFILVCEMLVFQVSKPHKMGFKFN